MAFRSMRFDGLGGRRQRAPLGGRGWDGWRGAMSVVAIALVSIGLAAWYVTGARSDYLGQRDGTTLCLLNAPTPRAELTLLDQTDPLAANAGARFTRLIHHIRDTLPRNGRLTIVPFGGDLGRPLNVSFDICSPGRGADADPLIEGNLPLQRDYQIRFQAPLDRAAAEMTRHHVSDRSPITAQILRAISDPAIGWRGEERVLNVLTDGLENTTQSPVYRTGTVTLPPPPSRILAGVTVNFIELESAKFSGLQTHRVRASWKAWFEAAGATVNMYAPGFLTPLD